MLLAGLAATFVATMTVLRSGGAGSADGPAATRAVVPGAQPSIATVADVKLDLLQQPPDALAPVRRDPFRFPQSAPEARSRSVAPVAAAPPLAVPTGPPPPPPIPLRYIGVIETAQQPGRVALLSDGRGGLMQGREGDIIEGRYRVIRVGLDALEVAYADGRGRQTIRLSGQ
jgi:hypothetical protein